ncbi:hypothetical protein SDC9_54151 [bioreactor metagenome]|uniref:Uncharacterized protein n=1 Tax=bioreactor metagenome TaxID=1076179 RepID=A0A644WVL1_9ZZZZ
MGRDHAQRDLLALERVGGGDHLAQPVGAVLEEPKPDRMAEMGREAGRGDPALIALGLLRRTRGEEMRADGDRHGRIDRHQAHKAAGVGHERLAPAHHRPDRILLRRDHPAHAEHLRRALAVQLIARGMALLDAQHAERLGAVGGGAEIGADRNQSCHQRRAIACRHRDLIGQFARERDPEEPRPEPAADGGLCAGHEREGRIREVEAVDHPREQAPRIGARDGKLRPGIGGRDQLHVKLGPQALPAEFHVAIDRPGLRRGGGDDVMVLAKTRAGAVIIGKAVLAQHQTIAHHADLQRGHGIGIDPVEEFARARPLHIDLAKRGHVADADARARRQHLAVDTLAPVRLARAGEVLRPHPGSDLDEGRALRRRPVMRRREPARAEALPAVAAAKRGQRHRRAGRAEDRGAGRGKRLAGEFRHHRKRRDVRGLALIGRHAKRGPALQMLDRAHVLLMRKPDVLDGDVVLQVDPGPALARHLPEGHLPRREVDGARQIGKGRGDAEIGQRRLRHPRARGQRRPGLALPCRRSRGGEPRHRTGLGQEGEQAVVPDRPAAVMAGQLHIRVPAARDAKRAGLDPMGAALAGHRDPAQPVPAAAVADHRAGEERIVAEGLHLGARVDHRGHLDALRDQVERGAVAVIAIGEDRHLLRRRHCPAVRIGAQRTAKQDTGAVVIGEGDVPLDRARGQHGALRGDPPQRLAHRRAGRREVVRDPFERAIDAMVEGAEDRGAAHHPQVRQAREFRLDAGKPLGRRGVIKGVGLGQQPPAQTEILVGKDHPRAGPRCGQRRGKPRGPGADDQQVAMQEALVIGIRVGKHRQAAKPRRAPDRGLVELLPERLRPHEGLVVEPRREERREQVVHRQQVVAQAARVVLAARLEPVEELGHRGAGVRLLPGTAAQLDERIRLLGAGGEDAARAVILERAPDQADVVCQERRGERVARMAAQLAPVEAEAQRRAALDQTAGKPGHAAPPFRASATSRASSAPRISCVRVLRVTISHERSPCS